MKRNPKIRLTRRIVMSVIENQRFYDSIPTDILTFTPIIYKTKYWNFGMPHVVYIYQNRIMVRLIPGSIACLRLRGKAPLHKSFTLDDFCNNFYMVMDEKTGKPYFKYYKK